MLSLQQSRILVPKNIEKTGNFSSKTVNKMSPKHPSRLLHTQKGQKNENKQIINTYFYKYW